MSKPANYAGYPCNPKHLPDFSPKCKWCGGPEHAKGDDCPALDHTRSAPSASPAQEKGND